MNKYSVTAVLTVYNTPIHFLKQAVESLLCQNYPLYVDVWLDGLGQKEQRELLLKYRNVLVREKSNTGLTDTLNHALECVQTPFILRQDADDVSMPDRLSKLMNFMEALPRCGAIGDNYAHIDETGKILRINTADPQNVEPRRYSGYGLAGTIAGGGALLRTEAVRQVGGWKYKRSQDCYMWHALTAAGWSVNSIQDTVYHWRHHREQISSKANHEQRECMRQILEEFGVA